MRNGAMKSAVSNLTNMAGPKNQSLLGCVGEIKERGILDFLMRNAREYGDVIPFRMGFTEYLQLNDPDLIKYILIDNHKNYRKSDTHIRFREVIGDGILTSNGKKWRRHRRMLQPAFSKQLIEEIYSSAVVDTVHQMSKQWEAKAKAHESANVTQDMAMITLRVILQTMFGQKVREDEIKAIDASIQYLMLYTGLPRLIPSVDIRKAFHTPKYSKARKYVAYLRKFVEKIYLQEKAHPSERMNMMRLMIEAKSEDGESFDFEEICDESVTMIFAGYETTSTLIQWAWYCLDRHPKEQQKVLEELSAVDVQSPDFKKIDALPILDAFLKETMRLYPPFWATARACLDSDVVGGVAIQKGQTLIMPQYVMHRHPKFWDEPEVFKSERFIEKDAKTLNSGLFFPFSQGPRKCIGYRFAEMEAKMVLAIMLPKFSLDYKGKEITDMKPAISLKALDDINMEVSLRL